MSMRREEERRGQDDSQVSCLGACWRTEPFTGEETNQEEHVKQHYT